MRLVLNCERLLTQVAMNAVGTNGILGPPTADWATLSRAVAVGPWEGMRRDHPSDEPSTEKLEACIRTLAVGEATELDQVLAVDAVGCSPSGSFSRREEAVASAQQPLSSLSVEVFRVEALCWRAPLLFAGWSLLARQEEALFFNEDILLEATGRTVGLNGTTVARIEAERVTRVVTHFDDADLIEQVILGR